MISRFSRKGSEFALPVEADVSEDSSRFARMFEDSGKGWFWEVDGDGRLTYFSGLDDGLGQSAPVIGQRLADLATDCWDDAGEGIGSERTLGFYLSRALPFTDLTVRSAQDPELLWALTGRPVLSEAGKVIGFRGFGSDLSEKTRAEAELRRAARYDSLTGLPNRATILKCLEDALRVASRTECALLIVDLDRFKELAGSAAGSRAGVECEAGNGGFQPPRSRGQMVPRPQDRSEVHQRVRPARRDRRERRQDGGRLD